MWLQIHWKQGCHQVWFIFNYPLDSSSSFTKPSLFVLAATGTNTFSKIVVTNCIGINNGGVYRVSAGSLTDSNSQYDGKKYVWYSIGMISYTGGVYSLDRSISATTVNITFTNSFVRQGGLVYCLDLWSFSITSGTISGNRMYYRSLFAFMARTTVTISAVAISSNTAAETTVVLWFLGCTLSITNGTTISNNTATGEVSTFYGLAR